MTRYVFSNGTVRVEHDVVLEPDTRRRHVLRPGIIVVNTLPPVSPEPKQKRTDEPDKDHQQEAA